MTRFVTLHNTSGVGEPIHIAAASITLIEPCGTGSRLSGGLRVMESPDTILAMVAAALSRKKRNPPQ
jgi:hypothetical protein